MSSNWAKTGLAIGVALAVEPSTAFAGEPFFLDARPAVEYDQPPQRATGITSLGQRLFFDTRLSRSGMTACASCHRPEYAFAEPSPVSISDNGTHGQRNTTSLMNVGVLPTLMWDGRLLTPEQQALSPFRRGEMGLTVEEAETRLIWMPSTCIFFACTLVGTHQQIGWQQLLRPIGEPWSQQRPGLSAICAVPTLEF